MEKIETTFTARWRAAYKAALALLESDQPHTDPQDPIARARVQRARTDTRRWIRKQKALAVAGDLSALQRFFVDQIPNNWREIDLRRRRRQRARRE